jgi:hypothetical protein
MSETTKAFWIVGRFTNGVWEVTYKGGDTVTKDLPLGILRVRRSTDLKKALTPAVADAVKAGRLIAKETGH